MRTLEHKIRIVSGVVISLIVFGGFLYLSRTIEGVIGVPLDRPTTYSLRAHLLTTAIVTCFLLTVTNYLSVRITIKRMTKADVCDHSSKDLSGGHNSSH